MISCESPSQEQQSGPSFSFIAPSSEEYKRHKEWTLFRKLVGLSLRSHNYRWKVLWSCNVHHSAPLEMPFLMVSLFAKIDQFNF